VRKGRLSVYHLFVCVFSNKSCKTAKSKKIKTESLSVNCLLGCVFAKKGTKSAKLVKTYIEFLKVNVDGTSNPKLKKRGQLPD